jgi:hypothetical protein
MYVSIMMFGWIITYIFKAGLVVEFEILLRFSPSNNQKYRNSIDLDRWRLMVLFTIPTVVVLSM